MNRATKMLDLCERIEEIEYSIANDELLPEEYIDLFDKLEEYIAELRDLL